MILKTLFRFLLLVFLIGTSVIFRMTPNVVLANVPYVNVEPAKGPVGTTVDVSGISFTPSTAGNATVPGVNTFAKTYFPDRNTLVKTTQIDWIGQFETKFVIGDHPAGRYKIWVLDDSGSPPQWSATFFTITPDITISSDSGNSGDNITVSGHGFAASSLTNIYFDDQLMSTFKTSASGNFSVSQVTIPPAGHGTHIIKVEDADENISTLNYDVKQKINVTPSTGQVDRLINFSGVSFDPGQRILVTINGMPVPTSPSRIIADPSGNFTGHFYMPAYAVGTYNLEITDGTNASYSPLDITFGGTLSRIVGYVGSNVSYTGSGFNPDKVAVIQFDGEPVAEAQVSLNGNLNAEFSVPECVGGNHTVFVTDGTSNTTSNFTVYSVAESSINREMGYVGSNVTFSGQHFVPGKIMTVYYDRDPIGDATVQPDGSFSTVITIPPGPGGRHNITANDGLNTANQTFMLDMIPPPAPAQLRPDDALSIIPGPETRYSFNWTAVSDPSGVTYSFQLAAGPDFGSSNLTDLLISKSGLKSPDYTLPAGRVFTQGDAEQTYYWRVRATDNAMNNSPWSLTRTFVIPPLHKTAWFMLSVIVEGGGFFLLLLFWFVKKRSR